MRPATPRRGWAPVERKENTDLVFRHSPSQRAVSTLIVACCVAIVLYTEMWKDDDLLSIGFCVVVALSPLLLYADAHRAKLTLRESELQYRQPLGPTIGGRYEDIEGIEVGKRWTAVRFSDGTSVTIPHGLHFQIERLVNELESRSGVHAIDVTDDR